MKTTTISRSPMKSLAIVATLALAFSIAGLLAAESPRAACLTRTRADFRTEFASCNAILDPGAARGCVKRARNEYRRAKKTCPALEGFRVWTDEVPS